MNQYAGLYPRVLTLACFTLLTFETIQASDLVWNGGGSNTNWSTAANWEGNKTWSSGDSAKFSSTFTSGTSIQLNGNQTAAELKLETETAFSLNGSTLTLTSGKISRTKDLGSTTINSALSLGGSGILDWNIKGGLVINGNISGARTVVKKQAGTLTLNGVNSALTGGITVEEGNLAIGSNTALGTGTLLLDGSTVTLRSSSAAPLTLVNSVNLKDHATIAGTGALTFTGGFTILGDKTLTVTNTAATTFSGAAFTADNTRALTTDIAASSGGLFITSQVKNFATNKELSLIKTGGGTLTLSGTNTFSGGTTLSAGTIAVGSDSALGAGALIFTSGGSGTLQSASGAPVTLSNAIDLKGSATIGGNGALTLTGGLRVDDKNLTLTVSNTAVTIFSGAPFTADDARTLNINVASTSGGAIISSVIQNKNAGNPPFSISKTGAGDLTLTGTNTHTGVTTISAGTLSVSSIGNGGVAGNLGAATSASTNLVLDGGTLQYTGASASTNRNFTLANSKTSIIEVTGSGNLTLSGASTATTGALTKTGSGTLTLAGKNLHSGLTTVAEGTLAYGTNDAIGSGEILVSGGTLNLAGFSDTVSKVTLENGGLITGSGSLSTSATSFTMMDGTSSINLAGSVSLIKTSSGTVNLTAASSYTGGTIVSEGTLQVNNTSGSGTGSGSLIVSANSTLGGNGIIAGSTTIHGTHASGSSIGLQTFGSTLTYAADSIFAWELDTLSADPAAGPLNAGDYDKVVAAGSLTGSDAIFQIILTSGNNFDDAFWNADKSWNNIFTSGTGSSSLESIFTSFGGEGVGADGIVSGGRGQFSFEGDTLHYSSYSPIPEPSSALSVLLIATGFLRRNKPGGAPRL